MKRSLIKLIVVIFIVVALSAFGRDIRAESYALPVSVSMPGDNSDLTSNYGLPVSVSMPGDNSDLTSNYGLPVSVSMPGDNSDITSTYALPVSVSFGSAPPELGLIALYHMDSDWNDASGNGHHGKGYGGVGFDINAKGGNYSGSFNGADGTGEYVGVPALGETFSAISVSTWVRVAGDGSQATILSNGIYPDTGIHVGYGWLGTDGAPFRPWVAFNTESGWHDQVTIDYVFPKDEWHHMVWTYDGSLSKIYIDGKVKSEVTYDSPIVFEDTPLQIGRVSDMYHRGLIDELGIWNNALDDVVVDTLYKKGLDDFLPPTIKSSSPLDGALINTTVDSVTITLEDDSTIDFVTTYGDASVFESGGSVISGTWSHVAPDTIVFTPDTSLSDGTYTIIIYPTDILDNSAEASVTFTYDSTAPTIPTIDAVDSPTKDTTQTINGTKSADSELIIVTSTSGTVGEVSYPTTTTWSVIVAGIIEGVNTIKAKAEDAAGNQSEEVSISFVVDTTLPASPTVDVVETPTNLITQTISGTKPADEDTAIYINGTERVAINAESTWSFDYPLIEGENIINVSTIDEAGIYSEPVTTTITLDTTPPVFEISDYVSSSPIETQTISGTKDGGIIVVLNGITIIDPTDTATTWSYEVTLTEGLPMTFTFSAADALGNIATKTIEILYDATVPDLPVIDPVASPTNDTTQTITGTKSEDSEAVIVTSTLGIVGEVSYPTTTTWSVSVTGITEGVNTIMVKAEDAAGNQSEETSTSIVVDITPPASPTIDGVTTPTNITTQTISGTKPADEATAISINGKERVAIDSESTWSFDYPLAEGENIINVSTIDEAGNYSEPATTSITLDTTPPVFEITGYVNPSSTQTQTISGTKDAGITVILNGITIIDPTDTATTWSYEVTLIEGIPTIFTFNALDALGNIATRAISITYDASAPVSLAEGVLEADGEGSGTEVTLSWPTYIETSDLAYYRIYYSTSDFNDSTTLNYTATVSSTTKTYTVNGLIEGVTYYFAIVPVDGSSNSYSSVNTVSAVPTDTVAPEDVTGLWATAAYSAEEANVITINWRESRDSTNDLVDQILYFDGGEGYGEGTSIGVDIFTYKKTGLADDTLYKFKVTTKDENYESSGAAIKVVTRLPNPADLTVEAGSAEVLLNWSVPVTPHLSYIDHYNVYRIVLSEKTLVASVPGTSFTESGLTNGSTYQYVVTTINTFGVESVGTQSIGVTPRSDANGPEIDFISITENQVISDASINIIVEASDYESEMGEIDIYIDDILVVDSVLGGTAVIDWNIINTTDGNHVVKVVAYDEHGNSTELITTVIVSLAPPAVPSIMTPENGYVNSGEIVTVTGDAPLYTTVYLKVNGAVIDEAIVSADGLFTFNSVILVEGNNTLAVKSKHRGGESAFSSATLVIVDSGAPDAPLNLMVQPLSAGVLQFSWDAPSGEVPTGYNLYESSSTITSIDDAGVSKVNSTPIKYLLKEHIPADDDLRYYVVTALDGADNESVISNVATVASDRAPPTLSDLAFVSTNGTAALTGVGSVTVTFNVSEPLLETPFFSLEPASGSPIVVVLSKIADTSYQGTFSVTSSVADGLTTYKFSGKDIVGNRGNESNEAITIDVSGPVLTITSPLKLIHLTESSVEVSFTFNEAVAEGFEPILEIKDSTESVTLLTDISLDASRISGTAVLNLAGLADGMAEFVLVESKDVLGNEGATVLSGGEILLYTDIPPPPSVPLNLTAEPIEGGSINLTWDAVAGADSYNLYRKTDGESTFAFVGGFIDTNIRDLPSTDGTYYYYVTSVGLLESESAGSEEVTAISDRTPPVAPTMTAIELTGNGVEAIWVAVDGAASYRLYRYDGEITNVSMLAHVSESITAEAVDPTPSSTKRFYAVTALDALGNESTVSDTLDITFPVLPVSTLNLTIIDDGKPTLSWNASVDADKGYFIYRSGSRVNADPVSILEFTDGYYAGGEVTYGISAVDNLNNESPIKEVMLPDMHFGLAEGTLLKRGLLETLIIEFTNNGANAVLVSTIDTKVGSAEASTLSQSFIVDALGNRTIEKVVATTLGVQSTVAVLTTLTLDTAPGTTVKMIKTSSADVVGSSTSLEVYNEPFVRGGAASVRLKVNNLGSAQMEFLTKQGYGPTSQVRVNLRDEDGNLLATGRLNQSTGGVINVGSYAVARLAPGESFLTAPVTFTVPVSAPSRVVIEAIIENTYYHYNKADEVTAPGMTLAVVAAIAEVPYSATAVSEKKVYLQGESILITGSAKKSLDESVAANVSVKLGISLKGFDRFFDLTTDADGNFSYTFIPEANEAGTYSIWAVHPDIGDRTVQAQFDVVGLYATSTVYNLGLIRNSPFNVSLKLRNLGEGTLTFTEPAYTVEGSEGLTVEVLNLAPTLAPGETRDVTLRFTASDAAVVNPTAKLTITTIEGASEVINANITLTDPIALIKTSPSYIDTGLVRGTQKITSFTIKNTGRVALKNVVLTPPSTAWMVLTIAPEIGDIAPGDSVTVGVLLKPWETLEQGVYDDWIKITSDNHITYTYNIQASVTSNAVGNVVFDVLNEFIEDVPNARITFQHQEMYELLYTLTTDADGTVAQLDIPEGRYTYNVSAANHVPYSGTFVIEPGITRVVSVALEVNLIDIEWSVTEITIEDTYEINITQTFVTNVLAPVMIIEPAGLNVPDMAPGEFLSGEFTVTNYGLIALFDVELSFPTSYDDYDIEVFRDVLPDRLEAMQVVTVPYRITRRAVEQVASYESSGEDSAKGFAQDGQAYACYDNRNIVNALNTSTINALFAEVSGFGGGGCSSPISVRGKYVICPSTSAERSASKSASLSLNFGGSCSSGSSSSSSGTSGGDGDGDSQSSGGGGGGGGSPITPIACSTTSPPPPPEPECEGTGAITGDGQCMECIDGVKVYMENCGGECTTEGAKENCLECKEYAPTGQPLLLWTAIAGCGETCEVGDGLEPCMECVDNRATVKANCAGCQYAYECYSSSLCSYGGCFNNECVYFEKTCSDSLTCTTDACVASTGLCENTPILACTEPAPLPGEPPTDESSPTVPFFEDGVASDGTQHELMTITGGSGGGAEDPDPDTDACAPYSDETAVTINSASIGGNNFNDGVVYVSVSTPLELRASASGCGDLNYQWVAGGLKRYGAESGIMFTTPGSYEVKLNVACNKCFDPVKATKTVTVVALREDIQGKYRMMDNGSEVSMRGDRADNDDFFFMPLAGMRVKFVVPAVNVSGLNIIKYEWSATDGKFYKGYESDAVKYSGNPSGAGITEVFWEGAALANLDVTISLKLTIGYDNNDASKTVNHTIKWKMKSRVLKIEGTSCGNGDNSSCMKGDDVKMLQTFLRMIGISENIATSTSGTFGVRGTAVTVDGVFGAGTDRAVKRLQKRDDISDDGLVGEGTLAKIKLHWDDYIAAVNKYPGDGKADNAHSKFEDWLQIGADELKETLTDEILKKINDVGGTSVTRRDILRPWVNKETGAYGHWGYSVPFRITLGAYDNRGSIGFSQIQNRYKYGAKAEELESYNLYIPDDGVKGFASWSNKVGWGEGFYRAFVKNHYTKTVKPEECVDTYFPRIVKRDGKNLKKEEGKCYTDDEKDVLSKGIGAYKEGAWVGGFDADPWPVLLKKYKKTKSTVRADAVKTMTAINYGLTIRKAAGIGSRSWTWKGKEGTQEFTFTYSEEEWLAGTSWQEKYDDSKPK